MSLQLIAVLSFFMSELFMLASLVATNQYFCLLEIELTSDYIVPWDGCL